MDHCRWGQQWGDWDVSSGLGHSVFKVSQNCASYCKETTKPEPAGFLRWISLPYSTGTHWLTPWVDTLRKGPAANLGAFSWGWKAGSPCKNWVPPSACFDGLGGEESPPNHFRSSLFPAHSPHTSAPTAFKTLLVCVIAQDLNAKCVSEY